MKKPSNPTILDLMGGWPWYFLIGELLMIVLFLLLMLPFLNKKRKIDNSSIEHPSSSGAN